MNNLSTILFVAFLVIALVLIYVPGLFKKRKITHGGETD